MYLRLSRHSVNGLVNAEAECKEGGFVVYTCCWSNIFYRSYVQGWTFLFRWQVRVLLCRNMKADNGLHTCVTITRVSWCQNTNSVSERRCSGLRFICCCYNRLPGTRYALLLLTINRHCIRLTCRHPAHAVSCWFLTPTEIQALYWQTTTKMYDMAMQYVLVSKLRNSSFCDRTRRRSARSVAVLILQLYRDATCCDVTKNDPHRYYISVQYS